MAQICHFDIRRVYGKNLSLRLKNSRAEIHQSSNFSLLVELFNGKVLVYNKDSKPGPASSDGRACALEIFASMGSGLNPASAGIFSRGIEIYSINMRL